MALKKCVECKKKVSSDAEKCPFCGISDPTTPRKACAECKKMVLADAEKCPFCEADYPATARIKCKECKKNFPATMDKCVHCGAKAPRWPAVVGKLFLLLIVGIIVLTIFSEDPDDTKKSTSNSTSQTVGNDQAGAWASTKFFIKNELKSPKSADFPWYSDQTVQHLGNGLYRVRSYVDAQNSFGALIRTHFEVKIQKHASGKWTVEYLDLQEQ